MQKLINSKFTHKLTLVLVQKSFAKFELKNEKKHIYFKERLFYKFSVVMKTALQRLKYIPLNKDFCIKQTVFI